MGQGEPPHPSPVNPGHALLAFFTPPHKHTLANIFKEMYKCVIRCSRGPKYSHQCWEESRIRVWQIRDEHILSSHFEALSVSLLGSAGILALCC